MQSLPPLVPPKVVVITTYDATSDDKIGVMMTLGFRRYKSFHIPHCYQKNISFGTVSLEKDC